MFSVKTILFATDMSPNADFAFGVACSLARDYGARLLVLHVYPPPLNHGEVVARRQDDGYLENLGAELRRCQPPEGVPAEYLLEEGAAADTILRTAASNRCDLIVVGTHGRTGLRHLLMGSVAEQVVRKAPCPVLTVKGP